MLANISVAKYLYYILTNEKLVEKKEKFMEECENTKLVLLWQILYETEIGETELLEERVYKFGSLLKEQDYFGREVFLCLVALLNLVIK